jgi:dihydroflavonol-4-reductase
MKTVGIIGGSGFIGSHTTKKFLNEGYNVVVGVTDILKKEKYRHLLELGHNDQISFCELNVENKGQLEEFAAECELIVHGGTPFQLAVDDPQTELFDPTIKGTENFLEVIQKTNGIKKVVFIASVAGFNTNFPMPPSSKSFTDTYDETTPRFNSSESHPYAQAKFIANQTVLKFIEENPSLPFEITTVSPVGVMGKSLSNREDSTSMGLQHLIKNNLAPDEFFQDLYDNDVPFALVDVRDVAEGIFKATTTNGLHGKDYLLSSETYAVSDISLLLNHKEAKNLPAVIYKNDLAKKELQMDFIPISETLKTF